MIRLTLAETKRLLSRRITLFFPLGLAAVIAIGIVIAVNVINGGDDADTTDFVNDLAGGIGANGILEPIGNLVPLMAFVIGASFIGADIKTGMLEHLLTWEPRRMRLLAARAMSLFAVSGVLTFILSIFFVGALFVLGTIVGTTGGATGEFWVNVLKSVLRATLAGGIFSALGLGFTILLNNSIASIVSFVIYWFIGEPLIGGFLPKIGAYLPITNASSLAAGIPVETVEGIFTENPVFTEIHGWGTAGVILAGWSLVVLVLGGLAFSRRDIA